MDQSAHSHRADLNTSAKHAKVTTHESNATKRKETNIKNQIKLPTTVKSEVILKELEGYDEHLKAYIIHGFTQDFRLGSEGDPSSNSERIHTSTKENPRAVKSKLDRELSLKRFSHPSPSKPFESLICSPLGLIPKKMPGEFRIIYDLSFPAGSSVNDQIPEWYSKVHYESIEDIIKLVKRFGCNSLMANTDIEDGLLTYQYTH